MKKMRKRNEGETLWAYINEWLKQYWWLSLIIQAVISCIYCGIIYLCTRSFSSECLFIIIVFAGLLIGIPLNRLAMCFNCASRLTLHLLTAYIIFNILQILSIFIAIF